MEFKATVAGSVADLPCFAPSQAEMTPFTASTAGLERGNLGVGRTASSGLHAAGSRLSRGREGRGARPMDWARPRGLSKGELHLNPAHGKLGQRGASGGGVGWDLPLIWTGNLGLK